MRTGAAGTSGGRNCGWVAGVGVRDGESEGDVVSEERKSETRPLTAVPLTTRICHLRVARAKKGMKQKEPVWLDILIEEVCSVSVVPEK